MVDVHAKVLADNLASCVCIGASVEAGLEEKQRTCNRGLCCAVFATPAPAYGVGTGLSGDPFGQSVRTVGCQFPSASA